MLSLQDVQRFDIICVFQPLDPSTFESKLTVSGDMTEGSEDKEDQPSPDDPERLNQRHQVLCGDVLSTNVSFPIFLFIYLFIYLHLSVIRLGPLQGLILILDNIKTTRCCPVLYVF